MLGKLFKHELRAMSRIMLPVTVALAALAGLSNVSIRFIDHVEGDFLKFMLGLFIVLFFIGMVAACVMLLVVVVSRFYTNFLKDEGYLMFTLPASTHELVWSKLLAALLWSLITGLVVYGLMALTVWNAAYMASDVVKVNFDLNLSGFLRILSEQFGITGGDVATIVMEMALLSVLALLGGYLHFYAAMSIGQSFANHKVLLSVVFYLAISFAVQLFSPFAIIEVSKVVPYEKILFNSAIDAVKASMLISCGIALVYDAILYFITNIFLQKRLNLA